MTRNTSPPIHSHSIQHSIPTIPAKRPAQPALSVPPGDTDDYLATVARMHARQDAWGRAARSASGSASTSDSGRGSRSPSRATEGLHMTSSFSNNMGGIAEGDMGGTQEKKGRKKVAKACLACQKSHVTCDDQRPCTRCVKKGIGQECVEGVRKKAKYLLEEDERLAMEASAAQQPKTTRQEPSISPQLHRAHSLSHSNSHSLQHHISPDYSHTFNQNPNTNTNPNPLSNLPPSLQQHNTQGSSRLPDDIWLAPPLDGDNGIGLSGVGDNRLWFNNGGSGGFNLGDISSNTGFNNNGMTAATSEYAMLDSMFAMDPVFPGLGGLDTLDQQFMDPNWGNSGLPSLPQPQHQQQANPIHPNFSTSLPNQNQTPHQSQPQQQMHPHTNESSNTLLPTPPSFDLPNSPWTTWLSGQGQAQTLEDGMMAGGLIASGGNKRTMSSSEVYKKVTKPYDYTEGYHYLMEYLTKNFDRKDILRVVHSLASYRPSLIALQMPMSEEDEIFIEKSFQRTLIELEKLISYSATPTAVWRRTGEVCYANPEFCSLVKRNENDILGNETGKKQYIYQLFSKPSIIAYWENFSVHAFENTTQNFFQRTSLLLSDGDVDCSGCYTIRRDVFDLPSVVIGQFLPIPADGT